MTPHNITYLMKYLFLIFKNITHFYKPIEVKFYLYKPHGRGDLRKKLAFAPFKKTIQHFAIFPKLMRKIPLLLNSIFSKSS